MDSSLTCEKENSIEEYKSLLEERKRGHLKDGLLEIEINADFKNCGYGTCRLCPEKICFQFMDDYIEHCRIEHLLSVVILTSNGGVYSHSKFPPGYANELDNGLGMCGISSLPEGSFIETEPPFLEDIKKCTNIQIPASRFTNETLENKSISANTSRINSKESNEETLTPKFDISDPTTSIAQNGLEVPTSPVVPVVENVLVCDVLDRPEESLNTNQVLINNEEYSSSSSDSSDEDDEIETLTPLNHKEDDSYSESSSGSDLELTETESQQGTPGNEAQGSFQKLLSSQLLPDYGTEEEKRRLGFSHRRVARTPLRFQDSTGSFLNSGRTKETPEQDEDLPELDHSQREHDLPIMPIEIPMRRKRGRPPKLSNEGLRITPTTTPGIPRGRGMGKRGRGRGRGFRHVTETLGKGSMMEMYKSLPGGEIGSLNEFHDTDQLIRKEGVTIASGNFVVKKRGRPPGLFRNSGLMINRKPSVPGRKRGRPKKCPIVDPNISNMEGITMECESVVSESSIQNSTFQDESVNKTIDFDTSSAIDDDSSVINSPFSEGNSSRIETENSPSEWGIKTTVLSQIITGSSAESTPFTE